MTGVAQGRPWDPVLALGIGPGDERLAHREDLPARAARLVPLPDDLDPRLRDALARASITDLYAHQVAVWEATRGGGHVGIVTGTASGKTLAYALPVVQRLLGDRHARALYLSPTKALAQDQARAIRALGLGRAIRPALYDGDADRGARSVARREANLFLTNPDMLHVGVLPHLDRWGDVLANLTHVIVDEAHVYRGVFGSHVANVLRRLRRLCRLVGAEPQFLLASATVANPAEAMASLIGAEVTVVDEDDAPRPARTVALWNTTLLDPETGERASPLAEAAALIAELVARDLRVICFGRSRKAVEVVQKVARQTIGVRAPEHRNAIAPYRAGYTPDQRRDLEARLVSGELRAVVATNALELGIDIGALDCAISIGFPGTVASLTQQWGRAGRAGAGLAVLIASADALDQYFIRNPRRLLDRPVEAAIFDHSSPEIQRGHIACAAYEAPLTPADDATLGAGAYALARTLVAEGDLRGTPAGLAWARGEAPAATFSLRSASSESIAVVHAETGQLIGIVERSRACRTVHEGAVYLHLGEAYLVELLDLAERVAVVRPTVAELYTQVRSVTITRIEEELAASSAAGVPLVFGRVEVTEQVLGFERRALPSHELIDTVALDLPPETFATKGLWFCVPPVLSEGCPDLLGTLHAAEHALISVLPLHAMCDRWDIGGLSTDHHHETGAATIFLYDGHPGGIGLTRRGYERFVALVTDARDVIVSCRCTDGCPSCIQSPKCGNLNEPLSKSGAATLLGRMAALAGSVTPS